MLESSTFPEGDRNMDTITKQIAYIGHIMFERRLTDMAGGNISVRDGDILYITPRYAGCKWHWQLTHDDIVVGPVITDDLLVNPSFSREGRSHLAVYRAFIEVQAIIHAHPFHILPFCASKTPIQPVLRATEKFGTLSYIDDVPPYSDEQVESIVANLLGKEELMSTAAAAVLLPKHGIFLAGHDLFKVLDALERIDTNAWCILTQSMIASYR
jgi:L-fuculose-phosphate aldolase